MNKVVLDTNIFVSSIFWKNGNPHKIVNNAIDKKIAVFTSTEILQELEKVLRRDFKEPEEFIARQIGLILEYSTLAKPKIKLDVVKKDAEDNMILECAVACSTDYVVSGDKHLLELDEYNGIMIVTARKMIEIIEGQSRKAGDKNGN